MTNPTFALLIGVSDYPSLDPAGAADLPAAHNDVSLWSAYCAEVLQLPAEQVVVLADGEVKNRTPGATTRDAMLEAFHTLGQHLAAHPFGSALVTFAGHGLTVDDPAVKGSPEGLSLAIAPSDTTSALKRAISMFTLEKQIAVGIAHGLFGASDLGDLDKAQHDRVLAILGNVTVVADTCYKVTFAPEGTQGVLGLRRDAHLGQQVYTRLLLGCDVWQTAYEIEMAGKSHGLFTFSLVTALRQWRTWSDDDTDVTYVHVSYGDLMYRTQALMRVLGEQDQTPNLVSWQHNVSMVPFLRPTMQVSRSWASTNPDVPRRKREYGSDNGTNITWDFVGTRTQNGQTNTYTLASVQFTQSSGDEKWSFDATQFNSYLAASGTGGMTIVVPGTGVANESQSFDNTPSTVDWSASISFSSSWKTVPDSGSSYTVWRMVAFGGEPGSSTEMAVQFQIYRQKDGENFAGTGFVRSVKSFIKENNPQDEAILIPSQAGSYVLSNYASKSESGWSANKMVVAHISDLPS